MDIKLTEEIRKYPFVRFTIPLIAGILTALHLQVNPNLVYIIFLVSLVLMIIFHFRKTFTSEIHKGILISLIFILSGYLLTSLKMENSLNENLAEYQGYVVGKVSDDPSYTTASVKLNIDIEAIKTNEEWYKTSGKTLLYLAEDEKSQHIKSGDYLIFSPQLSEIENRGNPAEFDYKKYLSYNMIHTSDYLQSDEWEFFGDRKDSNIRYRLLNFRLKLISDLRQAGLDEDELGVISALALGYRNLLNEEIRHNYASSGAMHILAVSGLHVGIVYIIILFILSFIRNKKLIWLKVLLTILLIWFYAFLTGLSPSVSRAATMFSFIAASGLFRRSPGIYNSIAASAFLLLVIDPLMITKIGFQLSYLAVIGIVMIFPHIYNLITVKNYFLDKIWSLTVVSVAAQIATAPISIFYFNQMSNYFLLTNYLLIPLAGIAIYLTVSVFIFSPIPVISGFFAYLLANLVKLMNFFTASIESLPGSLSTGLYINLPQTIIIYLFIIFIAVFFFGTKRYKHLVISVVLLICFSLLSLYRSISLKDQEYLIVYNINRVSAINLIDGKDNILFANFDGDNMKQIDYSAKNNWLNLGLKNEKFIDIVDINSRNILSNIAVLDNKKVFLKNNFIAYKDKRILLINKNFRLQDYLHANAKIDVDYIILSDNPYINLGDLSRIINFEKIIFDSSNSDFNIIRWLDENSEIALPIHNVKTDGAYVAKL
jgi:competence protein ComEC